MNRRNYIKRSGTAGLGLLGIGILPRLPFYFADKIPSLRINKIDTIRFRPELKVGGRGIQWMWLRVHTNEGVSGIGETYPFNEASESVFKDWQWHSWAGKLIGTNPLEIEACLEMIRMIREEIGDALDIGCEFPSYWNLPSAVRIAKSLEPYNVLFLEDMLLQDNMKSYVSLANETSIPLVISERLATRFGFREFLELNIGGIAMFDLTWCGGISEGKKISDMANTYYIPTMMHTAGGPVLWYASTHLAAAVTNLFFVESVYPNYTERYPFFFDNVPQVINGSVTPPREPGLGLKMKEGLLDRDDVIINSIAEERNT